MPDTPKAFLPLLPFGGLVRIPFGVMMNSHTANLLGKASDLNPALREAQKALAANPHSIFAHILVGDLLEAQGDLARALAAYEAAQSEFYRQHPNGPAPPLRLVQKSAKLRAQIRLLS